jgi:hypothetical protein
MIKLDLNNLTDEMVNEALPHRGNCLYSDPCIIGAMMTPEQRKQIDDDHVGGGNIANVCANGLVEFPNEHQLGLAVELQRAFDSRVSNLKIAVETMRGALKREASHR